MTEKQPGPIQGVRLGEVSVKRELTVVLRTSHFQGAAIRMIVSSAGDYCAKNVCNPIHKQASKQLFLT